MDYNRLLVTGGAGFIGSAFIRHVLPHCERLVNLDALTYAADLSNLAPVCIDPRYHFVQGDIRDEALVQRLCTEHGIDAIVHFAAESHVDRSIAGPRAFLETNVGGTLALLEVVRLLPHIHFHHISTDEVYGSLTQEGMFHEESLYNPSSPYAASKAASDHFVRAYGHTYGLSYTLSHCTNNYGPGQHTEKLIPQMIQRLQQKRPLPVYGTGRNVRDWIFVEDHVEAVWQILQRGQKNQSYAIGGSCEKSNLELIETLIDVFAELHQEDPHALKQLITLVPDRPGHDFRYAIDSSKMQRELDWKPRTSLLSGLRQTVVGTQK